MLSPGTARAGKQRELDFLQEFMSMPSNPAGVTLAVRVEGLGSKHVYTLIPNL
jgi:hypothetical protein